MKKCNKCGEIKDISQFHKSSRNKDGLQPKCKMCCKVINAKRYVDNKKDIDKKNLEWKNNNRDKVNKHARDYASRNKEKVSVRFKNYYEKNKERLNIKCAEWRLDNKENVSDYNKKWNVENREHRTFHTSKRRAKKISATLEGFDVAILEIYSECGVGYHVDHIIPLNHANVCGLHVPWNLQILKSSDNQIKSNKFDYTYENESWKID